MRIHFLCHSIHAHGTYFRWHNLAIGLRRLGHEVTVFAVDPDTASSNRDEIRDGVPYRITPASHGSSLFTPEQHPLTSLRRCAMDYAPCDVVHLFQPFLTAAAPWRRMRKSSVKARFYDWDDLWSGGLLPKRAGGGLRARWHRHWTTRLENALPKEADHLTTCSGFLAEKARRAGVNSCTVIRNGFWPAEHPSRPNARRMLGMKPDAIYLGFMGKTITRTERDWLFGLLPILPPNARLAICGIPEDLIRQHVGVEETQLDRLGTLSPADCRVFAAAIDIALLPLEVAAMNQSRFPIKFAEYLAAGTPVLCTAVGECADLSSDLPFVLKAEPSKAAWNRAALEAVTRAATNALPTVSLELVSQRLSWIVNAQKLADAYGAVIVNRQHSKQHDGQSHSHQIAVVR